MVHLALFYDDGVIRRVKVGRKDTAQKLVRRAVKARGRHYVSPGSRPALWAVRSDGSGRELEPGEHPGDVLATTNMVRLEVRLAEAARDAVSTSSHSWSPQRSTGLHSPALAAHPSSEWSGHSPSSQSPPPTSTAAAAAAPTTYPRLPPHHHWPDSTAVPLPHHTLHTQYRIRQPSHSQALPTAGRPLVAFNPAYAGPPGPAACADAVFGALPPTTAITFHDWQFCRAAWEHMRKAGAPRLPLRPWAPPPPPQQPQPSPQRPHVGDTESSDGDDDDGGVDASSPYGHGTSPSTLPPCMIPQRLPPKQGTPGAVRRRKPLPSKDGNRRAPPKKRGMKALPRKDGKALPRKGGKATGGGNGVTKRTLGPKGPHKRGSALLGHAPRKPLPTLPPVKQ